MLRAHEEAKALAHDRLLFLRKHTNHNGELVFDMNPAKLLLKQDVAKKSMKK